MGLRAKFNLLMAACFVVGLALAAAVAYKLANDNARDEVLRQAALMASQGDAISAYTDQEIGPLLAKQETGQFLPQTIPFWAAQNAFHRVQKDWPDYSYRDPALNPTNPADRPTEWEAGVINTFRGAPAMKQLVSERDSPAGPLLTIARPVRISDASCLSCHSTPALAPKAMVALYGPNNGFGWRLGETVGAQIVSVPLHVPLERARQSFLLFLAGLVATFAVMIVLLNVLLQIVIVKPVRQIAGMADEVSLGNMDVPEYTPRGKDEIASLAGSFNRMRRSLANAMRLLED